MLIRYPLTVVPAGGVQVKVGLALVPDRVIVLTKGACEMPCGSETAACAMSAPFVNVNTHGPYKAGLSISWRLKKFGMIGPGLKLICRVTGRPVMRSVVVPLPVDP